MLLLIDECVPQSVADVLIEHKQDVRFVVKVIDATRTPDVAIASWANTNCAIVVTWNYKHFRRLFNSHKNNAPAFPNMGLLGFTIPEVGGAGRLRSLMALVLFAEADCRTLPTRRFHMVIDYNYVRFYR
jgi:hypothetical protein